MRFGRIYGGQNIAFIVSILEAWWNSFNDSFEHLTSYEEWVRSPRILLYFYEAKSSLLFVATNSNSSSSILVIILSKTHKKVLFTWIFLDLFITYPAQTSIENKHLHKIWLVISTSNPQIGSLILNYRRFKRLSFVCNRLRYVFHKKNLDNPININLPNPFP